MKPLDKGRTEFVKKVFYDRFNPDEEYLGRDKPVNRIEPLVSVCVPAYQHEEFIEECLESILAQKTGFPFEILIGEDQSDDNTRAICKKYAEKYTDKIRLFLRERETSQLFDEDGNLLFRFNVKWLRVSSKGKYIALCEGDDYWTDEYKLQKQIDFMEANPDYSMCFHNAEVMYEDNRDTHNFVDLPEGECSGVDIYKKWIVATGTVVFRMSNLKNENYFFNCNFLFGDIILFLTLAENGKVRYIDEVMSVYRRHKGGLTHNLLKNEKNLEKFFFHHVEIQKIFPRKYKEASYKILSRVSFGLFKISYKTNVIRSLLWLFKSLFYSRGKSLKSLLIFLKNSEASEEPKKN